jgi:aspartate carbamoyltransferase catalytic subunit
MNLALLEVKMVRIPVANFGDGNYEHPAPELAHVA